MFSRCSLSFHLCTALTVPIADIPHHRTTSKQAFCTKCLLLPTSTSYPSANLLLQSFIYQSLFSYPFAPYISSRSHFHHHQPSTAAALLHNAFVSPPSVILAPTASLCPSIPSIQPKYGPALIRVCSLKVASYVIFAVQLCLCCYTHNICLQLSFSDVQRTYTRTWETVGDWERDSQDWVRRSSRSARLFCRNSMRSSFH